MAEETVMTREGPASERVAELAWIFGLDLDFARPLQRLESSAAGRVTARATRVVAPLARGGRVRD